MELTTEHHLEMESIDIETILPFLYERNWLLIQATRESGYFITSNHPVKLNWIDPQGISPMFKPGHGLLNTEVYFPLSKNLALIGQFDGDKGLVKANKQLVSKLNAKVVFSTRQVYAPSDNFYFDADGTTISGSTLIYYVKSRQKN